MISALVPSLTIYRTNLRSRSLEATDVAHEKKKKKKRKGKNHGTRTIQRILPCPFCLIAAEKLDGAPPLCARQRESASEGDRLLPFSSFFHQSANNSAHVRPEIRLSPWETASNQDEWPSSTYTLFQPPSFHSIPGQAIGLRYRGSKN